MQKRTIIAIAGTIAAASAATADHIDMKFNGTGQGRNVWTSFNGNARNLFAGQLRHQVTGGEGLGAELAGDYNTFCADLYEYVTSSNVEYEIVPLREVPGNAPMGADRAAAVRDLFAATGGDATLGTATKDYAAAFQIAVWEIVSDYDANVGAGSLNLSDGTFRAGQNNNTELNSGIMDHVNDLFGAVGGSYGPATVIAVTRNGAQDQLFAVPAPATAGLLLGGLAFGRRRRSA